MPNSHLYFPHLKLAQSYWKKFLKKGDVAIDATVGRGHDSNFLAPLLLGKDLGELFCIDIQEKAITTSKNLLDKELRKELFKNITFILDSHEDFKKNIDIKVNLIVYNLGYLPRGDKTVTTKVKSTLLSLESAFKILADKGAISIMCYPGHTEGQKEEIAILDYLRNIDNKKFNICYHKWINKEKAPSLIWIEKK
ncbi:MAG: hypothetical protein K940chlam1_00630 [Candidatus Anoxychlamydiales bacterium]|nr:hypothetical protein [Candidatus Anoxychlamydiales bacterium]NGX36552.1 hypothetical protein [Candidatus Anoxychlamydiales bacterium]